MPKPQVVTARILIEPGAESIDRTVNYVIQSLKSACRNIRDGSVVIAFYDNRDHVVGVDVTGSPSEALQAQIDDLFEKYENGGLG